MPPQAVQLHLVLVVDDPAIFNSICFLPLYAANSMSSSPLLCLEERRELVQLWLLLCWCQLLLWPFLLGRIPLLLRIAAHKRLKLSIR